MLSERIEPPGRVLRDTKGLGRAAACGPAQITNNCIRGRSSVKRLISSKLALWLVATSVALAALPAWAEPKIGVVDPQRLLEESPQGKAMLEAMRADIAPRA